MLSYFKGHHPYCPCRLPSYLRRPYTVCRMVEEKIVHHFLNPVFSYPQITANLSDQFAFRLTGSTTAAIFALLQQISSMLSTNDFVAVISMDFSKAFDMVHHSTLMSKLGFLDLPDESYNWLTNYFH